MRSVASLLMALVFGGFVFAQAVSTPPAAPPPTLADVRKDMGIPSENLELRGQKDTVGFASKAEQMAKVFELADAPPAPESFGPAPPPGVAAVICPHDDYLFAGRVYKKVLPLITARTVILVGVFHKYRRFGVHDRLVFDPYKAWRTPDGPVKISRLRDEILADLPKDDWVQDAAMHDSEHSLEAIAYWLKHIRPDVEIVPILVPAASFGRMGALATDLSRSLLAHMTAHDLRLGRDVAIAISTDGVHYGPDFKYTPFGEGGVEAYSKAVAQDMALLKGPLRKELTVEKVRKLYETFVNPDQPDEYRLTWCGRFAVPFGMLLLNETARWMGQGQSTAYPVAYATSVGWPELPISDPGLGATAPSNLYHFVGYPAVAFTTQSN